MVNRWMMLAGVALALTPALLVAQDDTRPRDGGYAAPRDRTNDRTSALPRQPLRTPAEQEMLREPYREPAPTERVPTERVPTEADAPARPRIAPEAAPFQEPAREPAGFAPAPSIDRVPTPDFVPSADLEGWVAPESIASSLQTLAIVSVVSLAPAILLMTTCFVRITIVLGLLRQALGSQIPPTQVLTSIAMFLTFLVMAPVWKASYEQGVKPYAERRMGLDEAWQRGIQPIRQFMILQIERTGNAEDIWLFLDYSGAAEPATYADVPLTALAPAFLLSELKTAFLIGFQIYLPFVVLDMVVSSVMTSMGMVMVPPATVSFPLKLLLFVLVDGWRLMTGMLLESFVPFTG